MGINTISIAIAVAVAFIILAILAKEEKELLKENVDKVREISQTGIHAIVNIILVVSIIRTLFGYVSESINYHVSTGLWGGHEFIAFYVVYFIFVAIHIAGILVILVKKNVIGLCIIAGAFLLSPLIFLFVNNTTNSEVFNVLDSTLKNGFSLLILSLFFFIKEGGVSAYKVMIANYELKKTINKIDL